MGAPASSVSKAGLNALTRLLAGELARDGILVNAVCPGWPASEAYPRAGPSFRPPPASSGPSRSRTAAPPAPSPATASPSPG